MADVSRSTNVPLSPADTWEKIGVFDGLGFWALGIESCTLEGNGVGSVRTITLQGGQGTIKEQLESEDGAHYSYSILEGPLPVTNYLARLEVAADGDGTKVTWSAKFDPAGGFPEEKAVKIIENMFEGGLASIAKKLG